MHHPSVPTPPAIDDHAQCPPLPSPDDFGSCSPFTNTRSPCARPDKHGHGVRWSSRAWTRPHLHTTICIPPPLPRIPKLSSNRATCHCGLKGSILENGHGQPPKVPPESQDGGHWIEGTVVSLCTASQEGRRSRQHGEAMGGPLCARTTPVGNSSLRKCQGLLRCHSPRRPGPQITDPATVRRSARLPKLSKM